MSDWRFWISPIYLISSGSAYPDSLVGLTVTGLSIRSTKSLTFAAAHKSWSGFFYVVCNICVYVWYKDLLIFYAKLTSLSFVSRLMSGSVSLVALSPGYCFWNARLPAEPIFSPILQLVVYVYEVSCRYNTSRMDEIFLILIHWQS